MQHYLTHLIADMRQAAKNLPVKPYYDIPPEAEGIEYVIEWENAVAKPMQEWFGIAKENFPPAEKLTDDQIKLMVEEMLRLWDAYHFYPNLPENLPAKITYKVLVDFLDKPIAWVSEGEGFVELCDYDPDTCPFPKEFCWCKDFENDDADGSFRTDNATEIAVLDKEIKAIEVKGPDEFLPEKSMQRYVEQLLADLQTSAKKFLEPMPGPATDEERGTEDTRQLIENPYQTLEELTGISHEAFPEHIDMDGLQTRRVLRAMLHLLDTCHLKVYFPDEAPHEIKYEALREYWDIYEVKHLPLSGDEIELCTGDPMTCPYGEYCNCSNPPEFLLEDVPVKYREAVEEIAENIDAGLICFYNPDTGKIEDLHPGWAGDPQSFEEATGEKWDEIFTYDSWARVITFDPPDSSESYNVMEDFASFVAEGELQNSLLNALSGKRPFRNFNHIIESSPSRQEWFDYKKNRLQEYVWNIMEPEIRKRS
jgi:hypothetical protein